MRDTKAYLGSDDDHCVGLDFHPLVPLEREWFTGNHDDTLPLVRLRHSIETTFLVLFE